jgi:peptidoglycan hydrolase-like protein with peptidoglycan-binding domain
MPQKGTAAALIEVARKELGTIEGPKDNETKYGAFTRANFLPWCGSYVNWCAVQAKVKIPNTVSTVSGASAFKKMKTWFDADNGSAPQPGDILYFDFPGDGVDRISHVGICVKDNGDGTVTTLEGNTSSKKAGSQRNGGEVCEQVRAYKSNKKKVMVSIVGWGRPNYKGNEVTAKIPVQEKPAFPGKIKPGDKNDGVKIVQKALGLIADGDYGPLTKKAVIKFQDNHDKLDSNGVIGPKTWAEIIKFL